MRGVCVPGLGALADVWLFRFLGASKGGIGPSTVGAIMCVVVVSTSVGAASTVDQVLPAKVKDVTSGGLGWEDSPRMSAAWIVPDDFVRFDFLKGGVGASSSGGIQVGLGIDVSIAPLGDQRTVMLLVLSSGVLCANGGVLDLSKIVDGPADGVGLVKNFEGPACSGSENRTRLFGGGLGGFVGGRALLNPDPRSQFVFFCLLSLIFLR